MIELNGIQISDNNINTKKNVKIYTDEKQLSNVVDKEVHALKGVLKDLHTPIAISTENTTESKAQNVRNIANFVAKAKAAGIADVNGMAVSCIIDDDYSGVGYFYLCGSGAYMILGVISCDDLSEHYVFCVGDTGVYSENSILTATTNNIVTSSMLDQGARKPIILTPETTEVDEETYQKLLSDDVDVVFKDEEKLVAYMLEKTINKTNLHISFSEMVLSEDTLQAADYMLAKIKVDINKNSPHEVSISYNGSSLDEILDLSGYLSQRILSPVIQEINLIGTDTERKAKLAKFEADWKTLTGASDMTGARFVGNVSVTTDGGDGTIVILTKDADGDYSGLSMTNTIDSAIKKIVVDSSTGSITITPLFSHLEPVEIFTDNSAESKKKNIDNINTYKANLEKLEVDTSISFQVPIYRKSNSGVEESGFLIYSNLPHVYKPYSGLFLTVEEASFSIFGISSTGKFIEQTNYLANINYSNLTTTSKRVLPAINEVNALANAVNAFGAIELKASDNAANKAALTAYKKILTDAGVRTTNGYSVPVRITGNAQEYHGMLNIGTGALLSGIVTDVNENHHYPFNVSTADGAITFDANNYFLEKTSNEVTEMLDAIKYSYTPVPLTATTSTNKTQLDLFLSKVPNAQVMHVTYKDVYAGTLHKIGTDWFGQLVKNTNNYEDCICIKLAANGTVTEGTTSFAQVNAKLDNIIG